MKSGCSASTGTGGQSAVMSAAAISSWYQTSRPSVMGTSPSTRLTTMTLSTVVSPLTATSALVLEGVVLAPRWPLSAQMRTLAPQSSMRDLSASALKPPNTTMWMAPMRAQASMTTGSSAIMGRYTATRSPFFTPCFLSTFANLLTSSRSSLYVFVVVSPESPSKMMAVSYTHLRAHETRHDLVCR